MFSIFTDKKNLLLAIILLILSYISFAHNFSTDHYNQSLIQAESFLRGELSIDPWALPHQVDIVFNNQQEAFWPLGFFTSVLLIPVVILNNLFGLALHQGVILPIISIITWIASYSLAKHFSYSKQDSFFLAFALTLGSIYSLAAYEPGPWFMAHGISVALMLIALLEWNNKRRLWLIGILIGLLIHTRYMASLSVLFFVGEIILSKSKWNKKIKSLFILGIPIFLSLMLLLNFNYQRFGSIFETGYPQALTGKEMMGAREEYGYFSIRNVPHNIFWYFFAGLNPIMSQETFHILPPYVVHSSIGYSFFLVSPLFIILLTNFTWNKKTKTAWNVSLGILAILLTHYTSGYITYGPRYMMDFLPLLYLILLHSIKHKKLSLAMKCVIVLSAIANIYLIQSGLSVAMNPGF
jgi:hypothetical protein